VSFCSRAVRPALLASALLATSLLTGCGGNAPTQTAATAAPTPELSSGATGTDAATEGDTTDDGPTDAAPFPGNAEPDTAEASAGARVTVSDIRIGRHDGFDRVVFEVGGEGTPGWDVRYVDQASSQGSGDAVEVAGEAVLQVSVTGAGYPFETGVEEVRRGEPVSASVTETVTETVFDSTFEGTTLAFVGTKSEAPFRVYLLEAPTRVVLEVAHTG
jgi:hypothetical protein